MTAFKSSTSKTELHGKLLRPPSRQTTNGISNTKSLHLTKIYFCWLLSNLFAFADSATYVVRPTHGKATLIPGQPLHFECDQVGTTNAQFLWSKRNLGPNEEEKPHLLNPNEDDTIEIHNAKLTLSKPNYNSLGDYICSALPEQSGESSVIKLRAQPYIEDFGIETSHTGKSATIYDGGKLELTCRVPDESAPVNITWLRSKRADDERDMVPLAEIEPKNRLITSNSNQPVAATNQLQASDQLTELASYEKTYSSGVIVVERVDNFTIRLIVDQVGPEHRGFYKCSADNGVTISSNRTIFIRVKDNIIALWPFLGILAELFILFTIIHIWETQKAYRESRQAISGKHASRSPETIRNQSTPTASKMTGTSTSKRAPSGPTNAFESVPLNS